jgi:ferredoxin--NADP+ reductase
MALEYNATLVSRLEVAPGLVTLRVSPDQPFNFEPGQYVVLGLKASEPRLDLADAEIPSLSSPEFLAVDGDAVPELQAQATAVAVAEPETERMIRRPYCIASESRAGSLEFHMTLISSGELTPRVFNLQAGDRLFVGLEPAGVFTLDRSSGKSVLMVATATGVAPYMAMLRNELMVRVNGSLGRRAAWQCNGFRQFMLLHGARHSWDLGYRTELMGLARQCQNFHYMPVITRPDEDRTWQGRTGYLQNVTWSGVVEETTGLDLKPDNFDLFLCGNPGMIKSILPWAEARGFIRSRGGNPGTLHVEEYW